MRDHIDKLKLLLSHKEKKKVT